MTEAPAPKARRRSSTLTTHGRAESETQMPEPRHWQRMRRQRLSRRALLRASARAGIGAVGLALVGCADGDDDDAQQPTVAATPPQQPAQTVR